ncbi:transcription factor atoh8 [Stigmatopora nigra]
MKDPHPMTNNWIPSPGMEPAIVATQSPHKKFKRKSREPKKLYSGFEPDGTKGYTADTPEGDLPEEPDSAPIHRLARRHLSGVAPPQSGALDMRIGSAVAPQGSPFANREIVHWPAAISQPLSNRLKAGPRSIFPVAAPSDHLRGLSPERQAFPMDPSMSGHIAARSLSQTSEMQDHVERRGHSPKESPRKRVGSSADGSGRIPEVKAIQLTRRLLANARERTRVHTISAAFEALRKQVPCYSYGQKLSKLAILRIACNYILSLAQLAEVDATPSHARQSFSQCVEQCTRTLQAEGRSKKRKVGRMSEDV